MKLSKMICIAAAVFALSMALFGCATADAPAQGTVEGEGSDAIEKISADTAHDMMASNEVVVLDVRTPEEYAEKHIVNARLLTLDTIDADTAAAVAPDKAEPVLVYCRSGVRSAEAAAKLAALGYQQVYDFGGIMDWPYGTVEGDEVVAESGLDADQLPVGVKVVCGKTKSIPEE